MVDSEAAGSLISVCCGPLLHVQHVVAAASFKGQEGFKRVEVD